MENEIKYKCDKCDGTGIEQQYICNCDREEGTPLIEPCRNHKCPKCLGAGELDWIENIKGKRKPKHLTSTWATATGVYTKQIDFSEMISPYGSDIAKVITDKISDGIAKKIDKEILDKLLKEYTLTEEDE